MNRVGSETHRPARRSIGVTRRARRIAAALSITAATVLTVQADTAGAASCSLRVVDRTADTLTLRYEPHDNVSRTVWVDGRPTTIAPHTTAVVRRADSIRYPTADEVVDVAELVALCGDGSTTTTQPTTTTSSTTTSTVPTTTSTSALTTITVVRTTPEPTTSTGPLPPATWTIVDPTTTTTPGKRTTLPETGGGRTAATVGLSLLALGAIALDIRRRDQRRRG